MLDVCCDPTLHDDYRAMVERGNECQGNTPEAKKPSSNIDQSTISAKIITEVIDKFQNNTSASNYEYYGFRLIPKQQIGKLTDVPDITENTD